MTPTSSQWFDFAIAPSGQTPRSWHVIGLTIRRAQTPVRATTTMSGVRTGRRSPFFAAGRGARPLSLATRAALRRLIEAAPGADFATHLDGLLDRIREAAEAFGGSAQLQAALGQVLEPSRLPIDAETTAVNDLIRFAPEGGVIGAVLRSLTATADLRDGAGFLPLERHGSTISALLAVCEVVAMGGTGIVAVDDLGEDIDGATTRHLAALVRKQARQAWITTRRASAAEAFRAGEVVRLCFNDAGERQALAGSEPSNRDERMFIRHFALAGPARGGSPRVDCSRRPT